MNSLINLQKQYDLTFWLDLEIGQFQLTILQLKIVWQNLEFKIPLDKDILEVSHVIYQPAEFLAHP